MFSARMYAPTYFPARFFAEAGADSVPVAGIYFTPRFFAPALFAPRFFPGVESDTTPVTPSAPLYRDRDVFAVLKALLIATGEFGTADEDRVRVGKATDSARWSSDVDTWANIQPNGIRDVSDGSPSRRFHRAFYILTLGVRRTEEPEDVYGSDLDRLAAVVENALLGPDGLSLGGLCLTAETKLNAASIGMGGWPEAETRYNGEFGYCVSLASSSFSVAV